MRIYSNLADAVKETERELVEMGTINKPETMQDKNVKGNEDYETKELQGYSYAITSYFNRDIDFQLLGGDMKYANAEIMDRLDPNWLNPGDSYRLREGVWKEFLHNGKFSYTYNERIREQLDWVIQELAERPSTRQAVLTIYDRHQDMANMGGKARIPCSMYYQFLRRKRNNKEYLDVIYTMRSCDFYTHFLYDVWLTMKLQEYVAGSLGIIPGSFTHFIGSLHAYKKDYSKRVVF